MSDFEAVALAAGLVVGMSGLFWGLNRLLDRWLEGRRQAEANREALLCPHGLAKFRKCRSCAEDFAREEAPRTATEIHQRVDREEYRVKNWYQWLREAAAAELGKPGPPWLKDLPWKDEAPRTEPLSTECPCCRVCPDGRHFWEVREKTRPDGIKFVTACRICNLLKSAWDREALSR